MASLAVYTFVFTYIFDSRWPDSDQGIGGFALTLFTGMVAYNVFGESLVNCPYAIIRHPNYVTKVIFPLEILPVTLVGAAILHSFFGIAIIVVASLVTSGQVSATIFYLPLVYVPLIAFTAGVGWTVAAFGVFLQDIGEFARMNAVYAEFFPEGPPGRSAVQVAALPLGGRVEIEAVALA